MADLVQIHKDRVSNTGSSDFPANFDDSDAAWDLEKFKQELQIKIHTLSDTVGNFDLINVDTSLANAFRRIMIAEVPSVAIEKVFVHMNTSVMHDEVLASRLGLLPLAVSPDWLQFPPISSENDESGESPFDTSNTIVFRLYKKCERNPKAPANSTNPDELYINHKVYSGDLQWVPNEKQAEYMNPAPAVANPDILLCKMRPGQEIQLECWAQLGVGADHAKFSPVSTASYRLLPSIQITQPITGPDAVKFQGCFPPGVVGIENNEAVVLDPRKDTVSRECLRHPEFEGKVSLGRHRRHFIFNVESVGAMEPDEIFVKSVNVLRQKALDLLKQEL